MKRTTEGFTIGKLAEQAEVGVETVRFYERQGLVKKPARRGGGYREYLAEDAQRIRFIKRAQELGFTLKEIKEFFSLNDVSAASCGDVQKRAEIKLHEIEQKLKDLRQMRKTLKDVVKACGDGKRALAECRILDCFESGWKC